MIFSYASLKWPFKEKIFFHTECFRSGKKRSQYTAAPSLFNASQKWRGVCTSVSTWLASPTPFDFSSIARTKKCILCWQSSSWPAAYQCLQLSTNHFCQEDSSSKPHHTISLYKTLHALYYLKDTFSQLIHTEHGVYHLFP